MEIKAGYWKAKSCDIDYILQIGEYNVVLGDEPFKYQLFCLKTRKFHYMKENKTRQFLENHEFIDDIKVVYKKYLEKVKLKEM